MGNTNIPQGGAANIENSRDTRTGTDQLTKEQKKKGTSQPSPKDQKPPDPAVSVDEALGGHVGSGHSPSDAT